MDINEIYQNIEEFFKETSPAEIAAMQQSALDRYPSGPTIAEYIENVTQCYPYIQAQTNANSSNTVEIFCHSAAPDSWESTIANRMFQNTTNADTSGQMPLNDSPIFLKAA